MHISLYTYTYTYTVDLYIYMYRYTYTYKYTDIHTTYTVTYIHPVRIARIHYPRFVPRVGLGFKEICTLSALIISKVGSEKTRILDCELGVHTIICGLTEPARCSATPAFWDMWCWSWHLSKHWHSALLCHDVSNYRIWSDVQYGTQRIQRVCCTTSL